MQSIRFGVFICFGGSSASGCFRLLGMLQVRYPTRLIENVFVIVTGMSPERLLRRRRISKIAQIGETREARTISARPLEVTIAERQQTER